ncbi:MAG: hypothetical protein ACR2M1_00885 [Gemmatimonadaceae bacterium]
MSDPPADALMSVVAVSFAAGLPQWRILLVSLTYAPASHPFVFTFVLTWANLLMIQRTGLVEMTASHAFSGVTFGALYPMLRMRFRARSQPPGGGRTGHAVPAANRWARLPEGDGPTSAGNAQGQKSPALASS